jgi:TMEM175 potassium channel family protein
VYAIVITLLVLDLHAPEKLGLTEASLLIDFQEQAPNFIAYLISFFVLSFLWVRHHWTLSPIEKCDFKTLWLNLSHLLFITLIPYTATLVGYYDQDSIAVIFFFGSIGLATLSLIFPHRYVVTKTEWYRKDVTKEWVSPTWQVAYASLLFALCSILISFINVNGALIMLVIISSLVIVFQIKYSMIPNWLLKISNAGIQNIYFVPKADIY